MSEPSNAHSPGPWAVNPDWHGEILSGKMLVAVVLSTGQRGQTWTIDFDTPMEHGQGFEANCRLIAAAPELLAALEWLETYLRDTPHHNAPAAANARKAIAKAIA